MRPDFCAPSVPAAGPAPLTFQGLTDAQLERLGLLLARFLVVKAIRPEADRLHMTWSITPATCEAFHGLIRAALQQLRAEGCERPSLDAVLDTMQLLTPSTGGEA